MDTSKFKDWKEAILERPDIVAEREFMERGREQFMQSEHYQEYLRRKQAGRDIETNAETPHQATESAGERRKG